MSSWFGESLSNLKGQLQNFTKEVLSEAGETEVADDAVSLQVKCEELQSVCDTRALEISALRKQNNELQRRLQGDTKTASPPEEDDGASWWTVEQRWDASYFGGASSSSSAGKRDRKGRAKDAEEKDVQIHELQEKLSLLERQRNEAEGCKEQNRLLSASVKESTERLERESEGKRLLEDKLRNASAKVLDLERELQKVQKQFLETLGESQSRVVETEVEKLQTEKRRLSSELEHAVELLGNPEQQEVIHGTLQALELENQVLKIRNAQLELAAKASSKGGEAGWDTLDDHDSRGRPRPSDALTDAGGTVPSQYEDDFDTLSVRSEVSEFSLQHRKQLEAQLVALQEEVERSEQLKETWANHKDELEEKLAKMEKEVEETETREAEGRRQAAEEKRCLSLEVEAMSKVVQDLETQLASLKEENVGLCSSLEELDLQHQGALDQLLAVKDALARDIEQLRFDAETLSTRMLDLVEEKTKETMDAAQLAEAVVRAFDGLRWRKDTLERKVVELSRERAGMATELDNLRGVLPPIPEEGEAEAWLLVAKDGMESLEGELERTKAALEAMREDKQQMEDHIDDLRQSLEALDGELKRSRTANGDAEGALEDLRGKNAALESEVQELRSERERLESLQLELDRTRAAGSETEKALEQLRGQLGCLESVEVELKQARAAKNESEEALKGLEEKNAALELQVMDLQSRQKSLELELERSRTTESEVEKVLEDLRNKNATLDAQSVDLVGRLQSLQLDLERIKVAAGESEKALEDVRGELDSLALELTKARAANNEYVKALEGLEEKNAALEAQVEDLRGLQQHLEAAKLEAEACRQESTHAKEVVEYLTSKIDRAVTMEEELKEAQAAQSRAEEALDQTRAQAARVEFLELELEWERTARTLLEKYDPEKTTEDVEEKSSADQMRTRQEPPGIEQVRSARRVTERALENLQEKNSALEAQVSELREHSSRVEALSEERQVHTVQTIERLTTEKRHVEEKLYRLEEKNEVLEHQLRIQAESLGERKSPELESYGDALVEEKKVLEAALEEAKKSAANLEEQNAMGKETVTRLSEVVRDKDAELERLRLERDELVRTIHIKHQESLQYHALLTQNLQQQQEDASGSISSPAVEEECARLSSENRLLNNELQERATKEAALRKELERLRQHMVSVEDAYTQETLRAEERAAQLLRRLAEAEEMLKSSSTAHTSASILANQQVEALREQTKVLALQRDEARTRLGDAEEQVHKQVVALRNLQTVLDKFQRDKDRDVLEETTKVRKLLQLSEERHLQLQADLAHVRGQLTEAKEGLKAAARLGEQLEAKDESVRTLKARVTELEEEVKKAKEEAAEHLHGAGSKVDRDLVKNLMVGYFSAPPSNRTPVLRVLADVLKLSAAEGHQLGLAPASATQQTPGASPSLSEAFVRFLESESQPQRQLRLLPTASASPPRTTVTPELTDASDRTSLLQPTPTPLLLSEVTLPTLAPQFSVARNTGAILKDVLKDS